MRLFGIILLIFLLAAFSIGSAINQYDRNLVDIAIDKAMISIENITIERASSEDSTIPNFNGMMLVLEKYIKFVGTFSIEVFRAGVHFGQDNPGYFEPDFITQVIKLVIILLIISLLIKPLGYLIIIIILLSMYIKDIYFKRNKKNSENEI